MPRVDATERSISPLMTMSVSGSAMIATSPEDTLRLKKFPLVRNCDEDRPPNATTAISTRARPDSQRMAGRSADCRFPARNAAGSRVLRSGSNARTPLPQRGHELERDDAIERDCHQEQEAGDGLVPEWRYPQHVQGRGDGGEQQRANRGADGAAAPAEDGHAADHHGGDDRQLVPRSRGGVDGLVLRGPEHARQPGDAPADREGGEDPLANGDPGQARRFRIRADRVELAPGPEGTQVVRSGADHRGYHDGQVPNPEHAGPGDADEAVREGLGDHLVPAHDEN